MRMEIDVYGNTRTMRGELIPDNAYGPYFPRTYGGILRRIARTIPENSCLRLGNGYAAVITDEDGNEHEIDETMLFEYTHKYNGGIDEDGMRTKLTKRTLARIEAEPEFYF